MNSKPGIFRAYGDFALFAVCLLAFAAGAYVGISLVLRAW